MICDCTTTLCSAHQQSFRDILGDIPDRLATMRVSIAKQAVMGGQGGKPVNDDDRPLPVNLGAAEANHALRTELVSFIVRVQHCLSEQPRDNTLRGSTAWAIKLMPRISAHPESVDWYTRIEAAYTKTTKAIDLPPERVRAGRCECGAVLYASQEAKVVRCKSCDVTHDVVALQDSTLEKLRSYTDTAANVVRALNAARVPLKMRKLTYWADHGHVPTVEDERGRVYRVGDVLDAMETLAVS